MSKFQLILTADYEIWGDGSGCVEKCVIEPADKMMKIAEKYDARITFFFDVCEYWAFEKIELEGKFSNNYKPATLIREQLQNAIHKGHDVQLHFHPQWLNYQFISNDTWNLDNRYWRLPEVENYHNNKWSIDKMFKEGVNTLNLMFKSVDSDYEVIAFRSGAWCIQPEGSIIKSMIESGILIDSTVAPGRVNIKEPYFYNFSLVPDLAFWEVGDKITQKGDEKLLELPICTADLSIANRILFKLQKLKYRNEFLPAGCEKRSNKKGNIVNLKSLHKSFKEPWMLNYSDGTTFGEMRRITELYMNKFSRLEMDQVPIVAISHPKTFGIGNEFEQFLKWIEKQSEISQNTITTWMNGIKSTI